MAAVYSQLLLKSKVKCWKQRHERLSYRRTSLYSEVTFGGCLEWNGQSAKFCTDPGPPSANRLISAPFTQTTQCPTSRKICVLSVISLSGLQPPQTHSKEWPDFWSMQLDANDAPRQHCISFSSRQVFLDSYLPMTDFRQKTAGMGMPTLESCSFASSLLVLAKIQPAEVFVPFQVLYVPLVPLAVLPQQD